MEQVVEQSDAGHTPDIPLASSDGAAWPSWLAPVVIILVTVAAFLPPLVQKEQRDFITLGEQDMLVRNEAYQGLGLTQLKWAFGDSQKTGHYHPLTWLSYGVDYLFWGSNARGYYFDGLMLHVATALLLYCLAARLFVAVQTGIPTAPGPGERAVRVGAIFVALLFAVHPLRVESVAWLVERRDLLCGFFFIASILAYLRCRVASVPPDGEGEAPATQGAGSARLWLIIALLLGAAATLSKATAACLPLVLLLLDFYPLGRSARRVQGIWWDRIPFFILGAVAAWKALIAMAELSRIVGLPAAPESLGVRMGVACSGVLQLLYKTVVPIGLGPSTEMPAVGLRLLESAVIGPVFVVLAVTGVLVMLWRRWPGGIVAWATFLVLMLPVSGLKPIGIPVDADRNSYLACIPWALLIGAGVWMALRRGAAMAKPAVVVLGVAVVVLASATFSQAKIWRDSASVWGRMIELDPNNAAAYDRLGSALKGNDDMEGAEESFRKALEIDPRSAQVRAHLGTVLCIRGEYEEAVEHFEIATLGAPNLASLRQNLGTALLYLERFDDAIIELNEVLRLDPRSARALNDLGVAHFLLQDYDQAIEDFRKALELVPTIYSAHINLADCWVEKGQIDQAVAHLQEAMRLAPTDPVVREKLAGLMSQKQGAEKDEAAPSTGPTDPRERLAAEIRRLREMINADPTNAPTHYDLANRLSMTGQVEEAIYHYRQAIQRQPTFASASYYLTMLLMHNQRFAEGAEVARQGLSGSPNETKLMGAMAWILASSRDEAVRDPAESLRLAEKAIELEPENPSLLEVLSMAQWVNDRKEEAIATIRKAESVVQSEEEVVLRERLIKKRESYEKQLGQDAVTP
jgi:tetratricopeptide (TPR) repeat protein